jgi:hypothetical protein
LLEMLIRRLPPGNHFLDPLRTNPNPMAALSNTEGMSLSIEHVPPVKFQQKQRTAAQSVAHGVALLL